MSTTSHPGLYCELYWGPELAEARAFGPELEQVRAAPDETAPLPLYGFGLADEGETLAERIATGYRIYPPPGTLLSTQEGRSKPQEVERSTLPRLGERPYLDLPPGQSLTLALPERGLRLIIKSSVVRQRVGSDGRRNMIALAVMMVVGLTFLVMFVGSEPDPEKMAEFNARALEAARAREEAERKELEAKYPSYIDVDGGPVSPENGLTLPTSLSVGR